MVLVHATTNTCNINPHIRVVSRAKEATTFHIGIGGRSGKLRDSTPKVSCITARGPVYKFFYVMQSFRGKTCPTAPDTKNDTFACIVQPGEALTGYILFPEYSA